MDRIYPEPAQSTYMQASIAHAPAALWIPAGTAATAGTESEECTELAEARGGLWRGIGYAVALQVGAGVMVWGIVSLFRAL